MARVRRMLPPEGQVSLLQFTDVQHSRVAEYDAREKRPPRAGPGQLQMF